ncbi:MAG: endonuclease domain-containing protein [Pseudomonadota bacterium]
MTLPEILLWQKLRTRPNGLKFRRQAPFGKYVLDFYCASAGIAIEVDGEAHAQGDRPLRDAERDKWFTERGVQTLRVPATRVLQSIDCVIADIVNAANSAPLHRRAGGPPPRTGEDL